MKKQIYIQLVIALVLFANILAQDSYLAKIGNIKITADDFKARYEFTPKVKSDFDSSKVEFLYSIIAEKLWALEAQSLSLDKTEYVLNSVKDIERKLVVDKLYKIEIESKIEITENEIIKNLSKMKQKRLMNFIFSKDKAEIDDLYKKLKLGEPFDSILVNRIERTQQKDGVPVIYGQMDEKLEDIIFSLKQGEFSEVIPVNVGWVIYYLTKIEEDEVFAKNSEEANRKLVKDAIFERKAKVFYNEFFDKYIKGSVVNADKRIVNSIVNKIFDLYSDTLTELFNERTKEYQLDSYRIKQIINQYSADVLETEFIKFETAPISLGKFLYHLEVNGFSTSKMSKYEIGKTLEGLIKNYIFEELLFREGYSRGLQNSSDIVKDLNEWKDSFLASYFKSTFLDSVKSDDNNAKEFYDKIVSENDTMVVDSFESVKEKIKSGLYFKELENVYIDKTVQFATKYGISVNQPLLNSIKVTNIEMMVYRRLGFGGEITAVPYLQSFYKWKNWLPKNLKQTLP